jgi:uncharacterized protein (DUF433 family)
MVAPLSLRLPDVLAAKVRQMATLERRTLAEMVRLLTEEAVCMREFPEIVFTGGPTGRRASFRDGIDVWEVLEPYIVAGADWAALRKSYPELDEIRLRTALRYYETYPEEIDARVALNAPA